MDDDPGTAPPVVAVEYEDDVMVGAVRVTLDGRFLAGDCAWLDDNDDDVAPVVA